MPVNPAPRKRFRDKVSGEMETAHPVDDTARLDPIVDFVAEFADDEAHFDQLLAEFVAGQRTWWDQPTLRG